MTTLSVPDMSCGHCKASVEQALASVPGAGPIRVDLSRREVTLPAGLAPALAVSALAAIGFPASVLPG